MNRPLDDAKVPEWRRYATYLEEERDAARADTRGAPDLSSHRVVLRPLEGEMPSAGELRAHQPYVHFAGQPWRVVVETVPGVRVAGAVQGDDPASSASRQPTLPTGTSRSVPVFPYLRGRLLSDSSLSPTDRLCAWPKRRPSSITLKNYGDGHHYVTDEMGAPLLYLGQKVIKSRVLYPRPFPG